VARCSLRAILSPTTAAAWHLFLWLDLPTRGRPQARSRGQYQKALHRPQNRQGFLIKAKARGGALPRHILHRRVRRQEEQHSGWIKQERHHQREPSQHGPWSPAPQQGSQGSAPAPGRLRLSLRSPSIAALLDHGWPRPSALPLRMRSTADARPLGLRCWSGQGHCGPVSGPWSSRSPPPCRSGRYGGRGRQPRPPACRVRALDVCRADRVTAMSPATALGDVGPGQVAEAPHGISASSGPHQASLTKP